MTEIQTRTPNGDEGISPVLITGLEGGLAGAILILIEQILRVLINTAGIGLLFAVFRIAVWLGAGALASYRLFSEGIRRRTSHVQAGILAGVVTGLATGAILVIFAFITTDTVNTIPLPEGVTPELFNQVFGLSLICCYGVPTGILATAVSYVGALLTRLAVGTEVGPRS